MRILFVDDDPDKVRLVLSSILEINGISREDITVASNSHGARQLLQTTYFDLLILDLALPEWADSLPVGSAGVTLLHEVSSREQYMKPGHIVGLTAFTELAADAGPTFEEQLWGLIYYDQASAQWGDLLRRKIKHILLSMQASGQRPYDYDLAIITALDSPEFSAVMDIPWKWQSVDLAHEATTFRTGVFESAGKTRRAVAATANGAGMVGAVITSMRLLYNFKPRYLCMTGIAAGVRGRCNIGDILVADPCWDYGSGKILSTGGETRHLAEPYQIRISHIVRQAVVKMAGDSDAVSQIYQSWPGRKPDTNLRIVLGPLGSGAAVRSDKEAVHELQSQHRKVVGLEMEAFGVLSAAFASPLPEVRGLVMKGVSDFADSEKNDDFQSFAAYTSASVLKKMAEKYLPWI